MSPARSSTFRCFETAGWLMRKGFASSITPASAEARRAKIARLVGSARAAKVSSRRVAPTLYSTLRLCNPEPFTAAPPPLQLRPLARHRRRHHRRQVTNHQHVRPAGAWVAAGNVPVVLREEHHTLEFRKPGEQFERRGADIAVVFRSLVAPGVVSQTAERHDQTDEGDGIVAQLLAKAGHLHSSIDPSLNLRGHRLHSSDFAPCAAPARRYTRHRTHGWRSRGYAAQTSSCLQLTRLLSARVRAGIQAHARKGHPDQAYL